MGVQIVTDDPAGAHPQQIQPQLTETARLASAGQMITGIAHELNNPLTGIVGFAELLLATATDPAQRSALETIHTLGLRCSATIRALAAFARPEKPQARPLSVNELVSECLRLSNHTLGRHNIEVECELNESLPLVLGERQRLQQVFLSVIQNARQALEGVSGRRLLSVRTVVAPAGVCTHISDNGCGMSAAVVAQAFELFFTNWEDAPGAGLGLGISRSIVQEHGGTIRLESQAGQGAEVVIALPAYSATDQIV